MHVGIRARMVQVITYLDSFSVFSTGLRLKYVFAGITCVLVEASGNQGAVQNALCLYVHKSDLKSITASSLLLQMPTLFCLKQKIPSDISLRCTEEPIGLKPHQPFL